MHAAFAQKKFNLQMKVQRFLSSGFKFSFMCLLLLGYYYVSKCVSAKEDFNIPFLGYRPNYLLIKVTF